MIFQATETNTKAEGAAFAVRSAALVFVGGGVPGVPPLSAGYLLRTQHISPRFRENTEPWDSG